MAFVLVEVVVAVTIQAPAANAALCDGPHCYGEAAWTVTGSGSGFRGAKVTLRSNCMSLPDYTSEFFTNELWAVSGGGTRWVEIGITVGVKPGGYNTSPRRFWAENKAAGYFEHYYESYTFDNSLVVTARAPSDGSNDWELWYGSGTRYTSVDGLTSPAKAIMTGVETTSASAHTYGSSREMRWYDLDAGLHDDWVGSTSGANAFADSGMTADWVAYANWIRTGRGAPC